ncbi:prenyltransferase [candidate division KSB1 bacterium]|nr:prenyltransferase [candidate division KSB1 bacterium]
MAELKVLLGPMRLPFLLLAPCCVLLGIGTAVWTTGQVSAFRIVLILIGAVAAHISVNALNEYFDFTSGLDFRTKRMAFSGGSGTLPAHAHAARSALITGLTALAITAFIGIYFLTVVGIGLLPLGVLGLFLILSYTRWLTGNPWLSLIAPGLGFGLFMVMGTDFVLTGAYSWTAFIASLVPFFLVSDLLLLNQFPDIEADKTVGRKHFPIFAGAKISSVIYGAFLLLAYVAIVLGIGLKYLPISSVLGVITIGVAIPAFIGAYRYGNNAEKLAPFMTMNVLINLITPVLVAAGLLLG